MSISTRIEAIEQHLTDDYSVLALAGADLTNVDKNILNLKPTWKERLLYFMNNGTQQVWDNWDKVNGTGTTLTLNNTEEAPMSLVYKGNTYQDSTTGKNLMPFTNQDFTLNNVRYYVENGSLILNGTSTGETSSVNTTFKTNLSFTLPNGTYTISHKTGIMACYLYKTDNTLVKQVNTNVASETFTLSEETQVFLGFYVYQKTFANINAEVMIETGSQATSYEPYTNGASPNPDYPQDIHTVKGDNTINVVGKNLLNMYNSNEGVVSNITLEIGLNSFKGTATNNFANGSRYISGLEIGGTYTISFNAVKDSNATNGKIYIGNDTTGNVGQYLTQEITTTLTNYSITFTASTDILRITLYPVLVGYSSGGTITLTNIQLEKSSLATSYEPYTSSSYQVNLGDIELCKIGNYQDSFIRNSGKNLLEPSSFAQKVIDSPYSSANVSTYNSETGELSIKMGNSSVVFDDFKENTRYTIILKYNIATNGSNLQVAYTDNTTQNITPTAGSGIFRLVTTEGKSVASIKHSAYDSTTPRTLYLKESGIFEGVIETTDFEPYGNGDWYLKKEIGKVVLDGSETWYYSSTNTRFYILNVTPKVITTKNVYSNYYRGGNTVTDNNCIETYGESTNSQILISDNRYTTTPDFKTWLSTHNTEVYYILATPTYTKIEGTLASQLEEVYRAKSYENETNISQSNNDLPFVLSVSALSQEV